MFGGPARHRPEELSTLVRNTKFSRKEIQLIYRGFKQVTDFLPAPRRVVAEQRRDIPLKLTLESSLVSTRAPIFEGARLKRGRAR